MTKSKEDIQAILQVIKQSLRAQGYVYADIAKKLGISEVTIKRLLSGHSISLKHLLGVCDLLQISLLDIATIAKHTEPPEYTLNETQDRFFSNHPDYYAIFIDLYRRKKRFDVKRHWDLDDRKFFKILRELERLELIEILPENAIRFKMSGPVRVPKRGLLRKVFFKQNHHFLEYIQDSTQNPQHTLQTSEILLSKGHAEEFLAGFEALAKKCRSHAFIDETILPANQKQSVRWLFAYGPYETDWRKI